MSESNKTGKAANRYSNPLQTFGQAPAADAAMFQQQVQRRRRLLVEWSSAYYVTVCVCDFCECEFGIQVQGLETIQGLQTPTRQMCRPCKLAKFVLRYLCGAAAANIEVPSTINRFEALFGGPGKLASQEFASLHSQNRVAG